MIDSWKIEILDVLGHRLGHILALNSCDNRANLMPWISWKYTAEGGRVAGSLDVADEDASLPLLRRDDAFNIFLPSAVAASHCDITSYLL